MKNKRKERQEKCTTLSYVLNNKKGITLIALVVTIVVLLILAGVTLNLVIGNNGIITKAGDAKIATRAGNAEDEVEMWKSDNYIGKNTNGTTTSKEEMLQSLKDKNLVYEEEIDRENEVIKIKRKDGTILKEISYALPEDKSAIKILVNSGEDGIVVLPIPLFRDSDYVVDWGDGHPAESYKQTATLKENRDIKVNLEKGVKIASRSEIKLAGAQAAGISHLYEEKNKTFEVTITGLVEGLYSSTCNYYLDENEEVIYYENGRQKILRVTQWGEMNLMGVDFGWCENLRSIAKPTTNSFANDCGFFFEGCSSLETIPEDLFKYCPNVIDFSATFSQCTSLTSIPEHLFDNCSNVTDFSGTFSGCTSLTGKAPELWKRVKTDTETYIGVPDGNGCFYSCDNLDDFYNIPEYWRQNPR